MRSLQEDWPPPAHPHLAHSLPRPLQAQAGFVRVVFGVEAIDRMHAQPQWPAVPAAPASAASHSFLAARPALPLRLQLPAADCGGRGGFHCGLLLLPSPGTQPRRAVSDWLPASLGQFERICVLAAVAPAPAPPHGSGP